MAGDFNDILDQKEKKVMDGDANTRELVASVSKSCKAHWFSMAQSSQSLGKPVTIWKPPPDHWVKVNVDTTFSEGFAHSGVVFRNNNGTIFLTASYKHSCLDSTAAESLAILDACKEIEKLQLLKVIIESDSLNAVSFINVDASNLYWTAAPSIIKIKKLKSSWKD
ncbi:hypothetical protein CASFOL_042906 [Castilleja foliolosa]|uniref:RNase H type-1 domain-containing protein n=1 Tax=Castilleja foliolosa TaxID=1961234 RepID=A0ABD3B773_9LAMI